MNLASLFSRSQPAPASNDDCPRPEFSVQAYGASDAGRKRKSNEDCFVIAELMRAMQIHHTNLPQTTASLGCQRGHIFAVADGVGGHEAGEVASGLTVKTIEEYLLNTLKRFTNLKGNEERAALNELQSALSVADSRMFEEMTRHPEWQGMGTTLTLAFAVNWRLFIAHAGDSRCYLQTGDRLQQITQDHTVIAEMVRLGMLDPRDQAGHPYRHVVTNIVGGTEPGVRVDLHLLQLHDQDSLLLCSDGLTEMLTDDAIAAILQEHADPRAACEQLIRSANQNGGRDNVTVIVARFAAH